jgi:hypothetical protein
MTDETNDHLPLDKPEPMKRTDWILLSILILVLLVTLPFIALFYMPIFWALLRFLLPLAALGFIIYFALRFTQLGKTMETGSGETLNVLRKIGIESIILLRKSFRKIALTVIIAIVVGVVAILVVKEYTKRNVTQKQMLRMAQSIAKYKAAYGQYPLGLAELIGNDPLKREWLQDTWGNGMEYSLTKNGAGYKLSSPGADGKPGSADDLTLEE